MRLLLSTLVLALAASTGAAAQAQACGSGGGSTVCLSAGGSAANVQLSWTASGNVRAFEIYRDTDSNPVGRTRIATVDKAARSFADTSAASGTPYWYWVRFTTDAGSYNSGAATATRGAASCTPTPVTPWVNAGSGWAQTSSVTVKTGGSAILGPQAANGGQWSWNGCGTAGASREQTVQPTTACTATATYTNACGAKSQQSFTVQVGGWSNVKWGGGGYVTGLIFHPHTQNLLYARTDIGGAYRWEASTSSWTPITDGFSASESFHQGAESIALDPNNDQLVYMVTGLYSSADATARLYISANRGASWTSVNLPFSAGANNRGRAIGERLMVDPNKPSILFYGSRTAGLWKSADSGRSWAQVTSLSPTRMTAEQLTAAGGSAAGVGVVVYDTGTRGSGSATQTIYAAIAPDYVNVAGLSSNLYRSTNGGASWTPVATPVTGYHIPHMVRAADGMFYVAFTQGMGPGANGPGRLYKFDGTTWTLLKSVDPTQWTSFGFGGLSVHGTGASTRIALGVTNSWGNYNGQQVVQLSNNAGNTWQEIAAVMPHTPANDGFSGWIDDVEIDPFNRDRVLHVHGGGIWETRNASSTTPSWTERVDGLEETATLGLGTPPPGAPYTLINSSGDIGTWVHTDLTTKPTMTTGGDRINGNSADMAWSDPQYIAAVSFSHATNLGRGHWSGDGGKTWAAFATLPAGAAANAGGEANIAVTARNRAIWAPGNSVPSYTLNNGASWTATNLPALPNVNIPRSYRLVADRVNPNKVYAYDSGGAWWGGTSGRVYVSTDGGQTFTLSQGSVAANLRANPFSATWLAVNPYAEGHLWLADGNAIYRSMDSGATWTKLSQFASLWGSRQTWQWPEVQGASAVALGKPAPGASYSAAVYVVGAINGVWGVWRSDDGGANWTRINDDASQFGGIGQIAADHKVYGRVYVSGNGRGILYSH
ncbi:MAG: dockerin [Roseateles sp.]|uniref:dockerin n=1 Tax=Roseateles sp. TaxID=1971397 RepID=UPI0040350493